MSIRQRIAELEAQGELMRYVPRSRRPPRRRLFLAKQAIQELSPQSAIGLLGLSGFVHAAYTRWTTNGLVFATDNGKPGFLKRLRKPPPEIWEVRITEPDVQVRSFGRFAEPDTLIITHSRTRNILGRRQSRAWKQTMEDCRATWDRMFPTLPPFSGKSIHEYVTENCDDFSING